MSNRVTKALKAIFVDGNLNRISQIILKTPLIGFSALLRGFLYPQLKKSREVLIKNSNLDDEQNRIVKELQEKGFARVDSLYNGEDLQPLQAYIEEKTAETEMAKSHQLMMHKDFWIRLSDSDFTKGMTTKHPLVRLSIKPSLLEVAGTYLKSAPYLEYILLTYSVPTLQPLKSSQLWHRDHDNDRMLKLFFYLSEVESIEDGPFTLLSKEANGFIKNSFIPRHLPDAEVEPQYSLSKAVQIKGKKFSAFLVDTSVCYHMGSRVSEGHSRLMSTSLYVTLPKAYWGRLKPFVKVEDPVSDLQKAALGINL